MAGMLDAFAPAAQNIDNAGVSFGDARQFARQGDYAPAAGAAIRGFGYGVGAAGAGAGGLVVAPAIGVGNLASGIYRGITGRPGDQMAAPAPAPVAPVAHVQIPGPQQGPAPGMLVNQPRPAAGPAPVAPAAANLRDVVAAFPGARWGDIATLASAAHAASQADTPMDAMQRTMYGIAAQIARGNRDENGQPLTAAQVASQALARQVLESALPGRGAYTGQFEMRQGMQP